MRRCIAHRQAWLLFISILALCFGGAWATSLAIELPSREEFNVVRWELRRLPDKWLRLTGPLFPSRLSRAQEDERLGRYLELTLRIDLLAANPSQPDAAAQIARLKAERAKLSSHVEMIIEGRITSVLEEQGLDSSLPLFPSARWVFPPVATEYEAPPNELVISPRDRIELIDERPLSPALSPLEIKAIEQAVEYDGSRSALVERLDGVATYPSIVAPDWDYQRLVELTAHEWVHQYLFFRPLGSRFYANLELRTLNETVATISGEELAKLVVKEYPLPPAIAKELAAMQPPASQVDVGGALRALRLDVDALLARGQVTTAEALMEHRRQELAQQGVRIRRINQAFFAFANVYATNLASTDPIGAKVQTLLARTTAVGAFLRAASHLTNETDLDRLLASATSSTNGTGR